MYSTVLVPLDGSKESEGALLTAVEVLRAMGGQSLILLRVLEIGSHSSWTSNEVLAAMNVERAEVERYLANLELPDVPPGCRVERLVHDGSSAAQVIAQVAQEHQVDLIVMTSHGRSGFQQFMVGSQTEKAVRLSRTSVLIARPRSAKVIPLGGKG